ncbi:septum formation initiator family protein [Pseudoramibacter sp.]|jgi:cell division protein FtsL|uniref:septum formation initiator family protein n=1 Tax=Pseudoramibacter sp. TaxID=2034862 RepID=UPI0025EA77B1|nr:septum formation initiator family protein [Pseudoramibacter sp.]MCH4072625.1 septum formation initiator family protein [Pseudoramibacter sp.]MCH4106396.1 septum formation initiator family protein [Pseudoramibacter sp.]
MSNNHQRELKSKPRQSRKRASKKRGIRPWTLLIIIMFVIAFGALVQQAAILRLDKQVSTLQKQVDTQKALNDSKEGKIVSSQNLSRIEEKARAYGMSEPTADQYVYMVPKKAKKQKTNMDYLIEWIQKQGLNFGIGKK